VSSSWWQRERTLGAKPHEAPLGIEDVEQRVEIARIGPPAVMKDESTLRLTGGRPNEMLNRVDLHRPTLPPEGSVS